jgi:CubicO group peptidase (beta-lactamase class C family)
MLVPTRFALGFMKSMDNRKVKDADGMTAILSDAAFGHVGMGGSIGFADPECGMSFGYAMNKLGHGILMNDRGQSLVDAAYRSLGYRSDESGVWTM